MGSSEGCSPLGGCTGGPALAAEPAWLCKGVHPGWQRCSAPSLGWARTSPLECEKGSRCDFPPCGAPTCPCARRFGFSQEGVQQGFETAHLADSTGAVKVMFNL